jgi:hypothetical protein
MRTVKINMDNTETKTESKSVTPWYIKAEATIKEAAHKVQEQRDYINRGRQQLRSELDAEYRSEAQKMLIELMAKRGLKIEF